jgi:NADPH:quinone reductase-like Zn-dependent oxidoreductase
MKAVVYTRYRSPDVLRFTDVEKPTPKDNEVLVKVQAVSLNRSDWEALRGKPLYARITGPLRPRHHILGSDIAGRVEATGRTTTRFQPGDDVFADILSSMGGFAEYVCVPESALAPMPAGMTYEEAAALPQAGAIALQGIGDKGQVQPGQKVLINGAGGGSGMYAVQLAKLGGAEVTGVDNPEKLEFIRSLGADHVIDYTRADFTRNGRSYHLILDLAAHRSALAYKGSLVAGGRYLYVGGSAATLLQVLLVGPLLGRADGKKLRLLAVQSGAERLGPLVALAKQERSRRSSTVAIGWVRCPRHCGISAKGAPKASSSPSSSSYRRAARTAWRRSRNGTCAAFSLRRASFSLNHWTRSISGKVSTRPDLGGHSIW